MALFRSTSFLHDTAQDLVIIRMTSELHPKKGLLLDSSARNRRDHNNLISIDRIWWVCRTWDTHTGGAFVYVDGLTCMKRDGSFLFELGRRT